jgi:ethanolamine utilization protein EutP
VRFLLIGPVGAGKTTLLDRLQRGRAAAADRPGRKARKTQTLEYRGDAIDTPGEYLQNPRLYSPLIHSLPGVDLVIFTQAAHDRRHTLPPGLLGVHRRRVVGVVTQCDRPEADPVRAEHVLRTLGINPPYYRTSALKGRGLVALRRVLGG